MTPRRTLTLTALAAASLAAAGCSSTPSTPTAASSPRPTDGGTYTDADALIAALSAAGIPCAKPAAVANPTATGATSMVGCYSPADTDADSDTVVIVFDSHADAVAFQSQAFTSGMLASDGQVVVGGNWAVNTVSPYGNQVVAHLGGQVQDAM